MKIVPISLPTPFYIGPVNVYLIAEDPITLVDTGPKTKEAVDTLRAALRKEGLAVADLRRIVLTHAHEDHVGALPYLLRVAKVREVWGTRLTLGLIKSKLDEHGLMRAARPPA